MARTYNRWWARFNQPDPYDGSYSLADPQSFNRYSYVLNDPVNFIDPSGLDEMDDWVPGPGDIITINAPGRFWNGGGGGGGRGFGDEQFVPESGPVGGEGGDVGGGGAGPQQGDPTFGLGPPPPNRWACDLKLARLFGGEGAVADTGRTPSTVQHPTAGMQRFSDHSAEGGVMHLYTNAQGTAATVGLYVPSGFSAVPGGSGTVYYPNRPRQVNAGKVNYNYSQYRNSAGITISFVHIGPPAGPPTNALGSTRVGSIAGPGGDAKDGYNHTHINFYSDFARGIRIDPRTLFCKEFGF